MRFSIPASRLALAAAALCCAPAFAADPAPAAPAIAAPDAPGSQSAIVRPPAIPACPPSGPCELREAKPAPPPKREAAFLPPPPGGSAHGPLMRDPLDNAAVRRALAGLQAGAEGFAVAYDPPRLGASPPASGQRAKVRFTIGGGALCEIPLRWRAAPAPAPSGAEVSSIMARPAMAGWEADGQASCKGR